MRAIDDPAKRREWSRRWRAKNPEQSREWREANPEKAAAIVRGYVERNPEKRAAHNVLNNAVRDGKIVRPLTCDECGEQPAPNARGATRIEGHHDDYSKPLEVRWLCRPCHKALHRKDAAHAA